MLPVAMLLDFGICQAPGVDGVMMDSFRTGMVMGTPYYMAPEQALGDAELDLRLDLWAAGVIQYEALMASARSWPATTTRCSSRSDAVAPADD